MQRQLSERRCIGIAASASSLHGDESTHGSDAMSLRRSVTEGSAPISSLIDGDGELDWQLGPGYSLGESGRAMSSITTKTDEEAGNAARMALKVAALSSVSGSAHRAGGAGSTMQPRLRYKVTMYVEHGVFLLMEDIHRLENTAGDHAADPTFELAFMIPLPEKGTKALVATTAGFGDSPWSSSIPTGGHAPHDHVTKSVVDPDCTRDGCGGGMVREAGGDGPYVCSSCCLPAPSIGQEVGAGGAATRDTTLAADAVVTGLVAMLDFEHMSSSDVLGEEDSLSMHAAFGIEGRYFNPRVQRSEHFLEPWR